MTEFDPVLFAKALADETRQKIIQFCESESLNRVYGNTCDITYKITERTGFDEDEVRSVLKEVGLWDKVIGLDQTRLKQLLAQLITTFPASFQVKFFAVDFHLYSNLDCLKGFILLSYHRLFPPSG